MAWFLNFYRCDDCGRVWSDEWSCTCDDECPHCGCRDMSPFDSTNLTEFILEEGDHFVVMRSPETAEHEPDYEEIGCFATHAEAEEFLASYEAGQHDSDLTPSS
jgi:hypothetical protein